MSRPDKEASQSHLLQIRAVSQSHGSAWGVRGQLGFVDIVGWLLDLEKGESLAKHT